MLQTLTNTKKKAASCSQNNKRHYKSFVRAPLLPSAQRRLVDRARVTVRFSLPTVRCVLSGRLAILHLIRCLGCDLHWRRANHLLYQRSRDI